MPGIMHSVSERPVRRGTSIAAWSAQKIKKNNTTQLTSQLVRACKDHMSCGLQARSQVSIGFPEVLTGFLVVGAV